MSKNVTRVHTPASKYATAKNTPAGKAETLRRKEVRAVKYAPRS